MKCQKKKLLASLLSAMMVLSLFGCGSSSTAASSLAASSNEQPLLTENEIDQMYTDADNFKGREVILTGQILGAPEVDDEGVYFQMFADPINNEKNTVVGYLDNSLSIDDDAYVKVTGTVYGTFKGENAFGGEVTAPQIKASSVEIVGYIDAVSPTIKTVDVNSTQDQRGYSVTLQKVEFADSETRMYLSVANNGQSSFNMYSFNAKIVQDGKQYEGQSNYEADYPEIQTDLLPGVTTEGIMTFPNLNQSDFKIILDASSDNWQETINPYTFDVTIS